MPGESTISSATPAAASEPPATFFTLQALRFLAALMVLIGHASFHAVERLDSGGELYGLGRNGVPLFFVISGFVMITSSDRLRKQAHGWREFAIKRLIRIVPMYWMITTLKLIALLLAPAYVLHAGLNWGFILKSYCFIPAINVDGEFKPLLGVGWTLNFEMFFYFLFTLALFLRRNALFFCGAILAGLAALAFVKKPDWPDARFYADKIVLDFLYGMIAARLMQMNRRAPPSVALVLLAVGLAYLFVPRSVIPLFPAGGELGFGVAACLVVFGSASLEGQVGSKIPRVILFLGAASYSLYLVHPLTAPLAPTLLRLIGLKLSVLSVLLGVAIGVSSGAISYAYVESKVSRYLSRLSRGRPAGSRRVEQGAL